tara:strand:+ start:20 stop:427 length:408 start_codon:yes stop_codon:yes gene_type:complete
MLGGGNPVSGTNPAGTGSNINYIGNRAYVYTGVVDVQNSETTLAKFSVAANQFIEAEIQFGASEASNDDILHKIKIDGEIVHSFLLSNVTGSLYAFTMPIRVIFAPGSEIELTAENITGSAGRDITTTVVGKVFS